MSHFILKCECGTVIAQCRCPDPSKRVEIRRPCTHIITTGSITSYAPITLEDLVKTKSTFQQEFHDEPNIFKCHPGVYNQLKDCFAKKDAEEPPKIMRLESPYQYWLSTITGVQIIIDNTLKPGEWKFEKVHKNNE